MLLFIQLVLKINFIVVNGQTLDVYRQTRNETVTRVNFQPAMIARGHGLVLV